MTTLLTFLVWVISWHDDNRSTLLSFMAFLAFVASCSTQTT